MNRYIVSSLAILFALNLPAQAQTLKDVAQQLLLPKPAGAITTTPQLSGPCYAYPPSVNPPTTGTTTPPVGYGTMTLPYGSYTITNKTTGVNYYVEISASGVTAKTDPVYINLPTPPNPNNPNTNVTGTNPNPTNPQGATTVTNLPGGGTMTTTTTSNGTSSSWTGPTQSWTGPVQTWSSGPVQGWTGPAQSWSYGPQQIGGTGGGYSYYGSSGYTTGGSSSGGYSSLGTGLNNLVRGALGTLSQPQQQSSVTIPR